MVRAIWTAERDRTLVESIEAGLTLPQIAEKCGSTIDSARSRARRLGLKCSMIGENTPIPAQPIQSSKRVRLTDSIDLDPAPFAVPIPLPAATNHSHQTKPWTALVLTDSHVPFHDKAALQVIYGIILDARPRVIVHLGDLLDAYPISKYVKDRRIVHSLQDEIDEARVILHQIASLAPDAKKYLLEGNHEARLNTLLNTFVGTEKEILKLNEIQRQLTWPVLLGLGDIGWEFVPQRGQAHRHILPKLVVKHGDKVRRWSGHSAKAEWERYGKSGISGHTHRIGQFYTSDLNGNHVWTECGCTCDLSPSYMEDPNWAHGCVLIHFTPNNEHFSVEPVYIQSGRALWRHVEYRASCG